MNRFLPILATLLALSLGLFSPVLAGTDGEKYPDARKIVWDYGYLPQKSVVTYTFWIHNDSAEPMDVTKIKDGCSCTSSSKIEEPIAPGDSASIAVTFKSGRYQGKVRKTTKLYVDGGKEPAYLLEVKADVLGKGKPAGDYRVEPPTVELQVSQTRFQLWKTEAFRVTNLGLDAAVLRFVSFPGQIEPLGDTIYGSLLPGTEMPVGLKTGNELSGGDHFVTIALEAEDTTLVTVPIKIK